MAKRKAGFYWHMHHNAILEWCYDFQEREAYIRKRKEISGVGTRLRLFQPVIGALPKALIKAGQALDKAGRAYKEVVRTRDKAWWAYNEARQALDKAEQTCDKAERACRNAQRVYNKVDLAYNKARRAYNEAEELIAKVVQDNLPAIEALHNQECPDCPWDGKTIFPKR